MAKSKFDFSKLKPVEDSSSGFDPSELIPIDNEPEKEQGFFKNLMDYESGLFHGIPHGLSDIGANVAQGLMYPFNKGYEAWSGKEGYKVPRADFNSGAPQSGAGQFGKSVGNFISPFIIPAASSEAFATKGASPLLRTAQTIVPGGIIGGLEADPGNSLLGTTLGAAGSAIPMAMRGVKQAYDWMVRPSESLKHLKEYEEKLLKAFDTRKETMGQFEHDATGEVGKIVPEKHFVETAENLSKAFGKNKKKINKFFEESYGEYGKGNIGQRAIKDPYHLDELHDELSGLAGVPKSTIREAENISPKIKFSEILNDSGQPFEIEVPAKNSKLEDYVRFMRETRDAAGLAFKKSKSQNLTQSEKERLLDLGKKLQEVSSGASKRVSGTLSKEESQKFQKINDLYGSVGAPLKYNPTFANAFKSDTKLGKISDSLYRELLQPENKGVRNYLFGAKDFKKALFEHIHEGKKNPLAGKNFDKKIDNIESLLKDKVKAGLIDAEEKKRLQDIVNMSRHQKSIAKQMDEEKIKNDITRKVLEEQRSTRTKIAGGAAAGTLGAQGLKYLVSKIFPAHND